MDEATQDAPTAPETTPPAAVDDGAGHDGFGTQAPPPDAPPPAPASTTETFTVATPSADVCLMLAELCYRAHNASYKAGQPLETDHIQRILEEPAMIEWLQQFLDGDVIPVEWKK